MFLVILGYYEVLNTIGDKSNKSLHEVIMPPDTTSNMPDIIIDFIVFIFLVFQIIKM